MPKYATKVDLKNVTGVDTSDLAKNSDSANLKSDVDRLDIDKLKNIPTGLSSLRGKVNKLDIGKLETTPVDLIKLNDIVKNEVVKKSEYNELVKINNINTTDTSDLVKKNPDYKKSNEIENKITDNDHEEYITKQEFN